MAAASEAEGARGGGWHWWLALACAVGVGRSKMKTCIMTMTCEWVFGLDMLTRGGHDGVKMDLRLPMTMTSP
jgi:hypothetical protein